MPGNEPYYGETDAPLKYTLGRYDFEVVRLGEEVFFVHREIESGVRDVTGKCKGISLWAIFLKKDFVDKKSEVCVKGDDFWAKGWKF